MVERAPRNCKSRGDKAVYQSRKKPEPGPQQSNAHAVQQTDPVGDKEFWGEVLRRGGIIAHNRQDPSTSRQGLYC